MIQLILYREVKEKIELLQMSPSIQPHVLARAPSIICRARRRDGGVVGNGEGKTIARENNGRAKFTAGLISERSIGRAEDVGNTDF